MPYKISSAVVKLLLIYVFPLKAVCTVIIPFTILVDAFIACGVYNMSCCVYSNNKQNERVFDNNGGVYLFFCVVFFGVQLKN